MSTQSFRSDLTKLIRDWIKDEYPDTDVCYENGPAMDQEKVSSPWVDIEVRFHSAKNVTTGVRPRGRDYGVVSTNVYVRQGDGPAAADGLLDGLRELLRNRHVGGGVLEFPQRASAPPRLGWYMAGLLTPFFLDSE